MITPKDRAFDAMLKTLRDTLVTMDANRIGLPVTREHIGQAIALAESATHPANDPALVADAILRAKL